MPLLFNPATYDPTSFDESTRATLLALVDFFETKGLARNKEEYYSGEWYTDFLDLIAKIPPRDAGDAVPRRAPGVVNAGGRCRSSAVRGGRGSCRRVRSPRRDSA